MCRVLALLFLCVLLLTSCAGCLAIWTEGPSDQNRPLAEQDMLESSPCAPVIESDSGFEDESFIRQYADLIAQVAGDDPEGLLARLPNSEQLVSHIQSVGSEPTISDSLITLRDAVQVYETKLLVIANNLANADTIGYKRASLCVESCAYPNRQLPKQADTGDERAPNEVAVRTGVRMAGIRRDFSQGAFLDTGCRMDVAIVGIGFFQLTVIETGETVYSRAGDFDLDVSGQIVHGSLEPCRVLEPAIFIPADGMDVSVSSSGTVMYRLPGSTTPIETGQIKLVKFQNPNALTPCDGGCYRASEASGPPTVVAPGENGVGSLRSGLLEESNVSPIREYVDWAVTFRRWQHLLRMIQFRETVEREVVELESHTKSIGMEFKRIPVGE